MQHTLSLEGFGIRVRPVALEDAAFIVALRHADHAKGKLGDSSQSVAAQEEWLRRYFNRPGDYYFIVETLGHVPVGTCGLYDHQADSMECGRLIIARGNPAALPALMLMFRMAFDVLKAREMRATSIMTNTPVHSLIQKLGGRQVRVESAGRTIEGKAVDMKHFCISKDEWANHQSSLVKLALYAGNRMVRSHHQTQTATPPAISRRRSGG